MTVEEYTNSCLKFAEASKGWPDDGLDAGSFYTTFDGSWEMTADNQNGGVGIEWAFHLTEEEIRAQAAQKLLEHIAQELDMAVALGGEELAYTARMLSGLLKPGVYSNSEIK